ncbi:MerR family transcriptional regulator [Streptomyces fructofermentans]|uniref:MerR family transcriptional regulator n=1 Tax=Streptomyces fructofermentans TaxID=152141 RepID=UPI003787F1CD
MDELEAPEPGGHGSLRAEPGAEEPPETAVTTGALARRLGVSPTTLRSWDRRYGVGPAVRGDGRHRRWTPRDVAMLEEMCRLTSAGVPPAEAAAAAKQGAGPRPSADDRSAPARRGPGGVLRPGNVRQECRGLSRAAVRLDAPAVESRLATLVARHGLVATWEEVLVPTLHAVGRKWETSGDQYVEVEHLLSWHISTALRRVTPIAEVATGAGSAAPVLLACVPGEQHSLPLEALNAGLAERGLPTRMFGAAVPAEALTEAVRRLGPVAVVLWAQARSTASLALARHVAATRWGVKGARRHPVVVLGGPGWAGHPVQGMLRPSGLSEALDSLVGASEPGEARPEG